jgi:hypothetical protein
MHTHTPTRRSRSNRRRERGIALVFAVFTIAALLVAITGALVTSSANSKAAVNYRQASQTHFVAESGISHALQTMNSIGVVNYNNEIVSNWGTMFGTGAKTFSALPGAAAVAKGDTSTYSYTVTNTAGALPASQGILVATANQKDSSGTVISTNTVVARIQRASNPSTAPGAIYLANDNSTNSTFNGNSFTIDGNDHTLAGGTGSGLSIPGISTRNAANTSETVGSLSTQEMDNVQGYGYQAGPPIVSSITTSPWAPTVSQINQMIRDMSPAPDQCTCTQVNNSCTTCSFGDPYAAGGPSCKAVQFGTLDSPMNVQVKNNGNIDGCGVMIINGNFDIQGDVTFRGLIIVKGTLSVTGSSLMYGSVWTEGVNLNVGGNGQIYYSSEAMALANSVYPTGIVPAPMQLLSMADCADLGAGVGNCP